MVSTGGRIYITMPIIKLDKPKEVMEMLPKEKSKIDNRLSSQTFLIYGENRIGKSTLASRFPNAIFAACEPGHKQLEIYKQDIRSWEEFIKFCGALVKEEHNFETIVIDPIKRLMTFCSAYVCAQRNIEYPGDMPMGKGWYFLAQEFDRVIEKLRNLGYCIVFIGHSKLIEINHGRNVKPYNRTIFNMSGQTRDIVVNATDHTLFLDKEVRGDEEIRIIRTRNSKFWEAGCRNEKLEAATAIPLNYDELAKYFN